MGPLVRRRVAADLIPFGRVPVGVFSLRIVLLATLRIWGRETLDVLLGLGIPGIPRHFTETQRPMPNFNCNGLGTNKISGPSAATAAFLTSNFVCCSFDFELSCVIPFDSAVGRVRGSQRELGLRANRPSLVFNIS